MSDIVSMEIKEAVPKAYLPFSAYVIQTRALPDSRDCLKTGGRYILWSQYFNKNTYDKNRKKGSDVVGATMHWNPHGDAGIYGAVVRMAKPFAMRYLLEDAKGNVGTMTAGDDHTQMRYLELRSSKLASEFTNLIKKDTIDLWKMNFTQEHEYPSVFPTLFPNFVNGNTGIGVGCVSSIPTFNLNEAIESLKKLVYNRDTDYDEIYIAPDFPTGAIIINAEEVKESLRTGRGKAVRLRAVIDYNATTNSLEVKEVPYQVFTNRIMGEIEAGIESGKLTGIKGYFDGTDKSCGKYGTKIVIDLNKGTNPERLCKQLFKETSLQSSYTICQLMLENGITPKQYGLREMMLAYLDHAMTCLKKSYLFDYKKISKSINIKKGLLIAVANINEIIEYIKNAEKDTELIELFEKKYGLNEEQTKAILEFKLKQLMKLEGIKIKNELNKLYKEANELKKLIEDEDSFKQSFVKELDRIKKEYGDERRTKVLNLNFSSKDDNTEPIEEKQLLIYYTNLGNIYTQESSTLLRTRRGTKGSKIKLANNEFVENMITDSNLGSLLVFSNKGQMYHISTDELPIGSKINISQLFEFSQDEHPTAITSLSDKSIKYFIFITKNGMIKKTESKEYLSRHGKSIKAINLKDDDEVISVLFTNDARAGILTNNGNFVIIETEEISAIGRATAGVRAIKLSPNDFVIDAREIKTNDKFLVALSKNGLIKKTSLTEFPICNRGIKGKRISETKDNDLIVKFLTFNEDCDIIITSERKVIKISTTELRELSRAALGVKSINLDENDFARDLKRGQNEY